jgi:hypothetical protein
MPLPPPPRCAGARHSSELRQQHEPEQGIWYQAPDAALQQELAATMP